MAQSLVSDPALTLAEDELRALRQKHYDALVVDIAEVHADLRIIRVRPDWGNTSYLPGQYSVIGLGNWEPRVSGVQPEPMDETHLRKVLKRAYSFSCPMLGTDGKLLPPQRCDFLEFYIVLVRQGEEHPPGLTPRLFGLREGHRLFVGPKVTGHYTLQGLQPSDNAVFIATGTGEAPHNAMVAHLLSAGHQGRLLSVICARQKRDLGYLAVHRQLEREYSNYRYVTLTTREPENLDPAVSGYVGRRYLQDLVESGDLERQAGFTLDPQHTHVFLCGNPAMIGAPPRSPDGGRHYPQPTGMIEVLERRGFVADEPGRPGNIHFEKYW